MIIAVKLPRLSPLAQTIAIGSFYEHYKGPNTKCSTVLFIQKLSKSSWL